MSDNESIDTDTNIPAVMWTDPLLPQRRQRQSSRRRRRLLDRHHIRHIEREQARSPHSNTTTTTTTMRQTIAWWWNDWFHTLAYQRTTTLIAYLFLAYILLVVTFAGLYLTVSCTVCNMDIHVPMEALYFSLSTQATIGYGVSDYYFGGCWTPFLLVLLQVWTALLFDAVAIGLVFSRLSRGHKRSKTVWFSRVACIRRVDGDDHDDDNHWYLYIRLAEGRHHPLFQTHVKAYCVRHERLACSSSSSQNNDTTTTTTTTTTRIETTPFVTHPVAWLESNVWMRLPQVVVHALDDTSPLVPPRDGWYDAQGHYRRSTDTHFAQSLQDFWSDRSIELVVLLEGIDELTGSVSQTQHSYTVEELVWQAQFVPCVRSDGDDDHGCVVDFAQFHETRPVMEGAPCPYVLFS